MEVHSIETAAEYVARTDDIARPVRDRLAGLLRAAAHERARGRPLPLKIEYALRDLIVAVRADIGYEDGDDLIVP